jgi:hypothetical protein
MMLKLAILIAAIIAAYICLGIGSSCLCALGARLEGQTEPPSDRQIAVAILIWPYSMSLLLWHLFIYFATLPARMIFERRGNK